MSKVWVEDHQCWVSEVIHLPCGNEAYFCHEAGHGYRCSACFAVVGSMGQPSYCVEESEKYNMFQALGSKARWNYELGCEELENESN